MSSSFSSTGASGAADGAAGADGTIHLGAQRQHGSVHLGAQRQHGSIHLGAPRRTWVHVIDADHLHVSSAFSATLDNACNSAADRSTYAVEDQSPGDALSAWYGISMYLNVFQCISRYHAM
jgi:hypothetical protein